MIKANETKKDKIKVMAILFWRKTMVMVKQIKFSAVKVRRNTSPSTTLISTPSQAALDNAYIVKN